MLGDVLGDDISAGYCLAARDDLFVGGDTIDEALNNWNAVLTKVAQNNLKVTARKVRVFLNDTEVFGHRIKDGQVSPSDHNINSLAKTKIEELKTVRQLNEWKGLYKTLIRHMPNLAIYMSPFDTACGGKASSSQFDWSAPGLVEAFNAATNHLGKIHKTFLPHPDEQLYLLPDTSKINLCAGWVLYTRRVSKEGDKLLPVQYASAKLPMYMSTWCPCELEGVGTVIAINQVRHWINESKNTTIVLPDNKPVVDAANMMKMGRHSKNARLQSLLTSVNRSNITFQHNSAKAGLHLVPDAASRIKTSCGSSDCQVERFIQDLPQQVQCMSILGSTLPVNILTVMGTDPVIIAATSMEFSKLFELGGVGPIPLGSRQAWLNIQQESNICRRFLDLKKLGQLPGRKDRDKAVLNKMLKRCIVEKGLIVARQFDQNIMKEIDRTFVPNLFLPSILTILHIKLNHPLASQLLRLFEKYFVAFNVKRECDDLTKDCSVCTSLARFPKELEQYNPQLVPLHPGSHMNIDVMQRAGQKILVNCDLFSGFTTACITDTEQREDMICAILCTVTPIRHCATVQVRVDRAPTLRSLAVNPDEQLQSNGIILEPGEHYNKNSNCSVDKKIQELELEIKRICSKETKITTGVLSQAVTNLNNRIRNQGMSAGQIHFSRDTSRGENLHLNDKNLMQNKIDKRLANHPVSARSKAPANTKQHQSPSIKPGQIVFARDDGSKHAARDPLLVTSVLGNKVKVQKVLHSNPHSNKSLKITSENIVADEKFLYVPPHKRRGKLVRKGSSDDSWWRDSMPAKQAKIPSWTPTQRDDTYLEDDYYVSVNKNCEEDRDRMGDDEDRIEVNNQIEEEEENNDQIGRYENDDKSEGQDDQFEEHGSGDQIDENENVDQIEEDDDDDQTREDETYAQYENDGCAKPIVNDDQQDIPIEPVIDQHRHPRQGDVIRAIIGNYWRTITLTSNEVRGWRHYYHCILDDGTNDGLYLYPDSIHAGEPYWTFCLSDNKSDQDGSIEDNNEDDQETERQDSAPLNDRIITPETSGIHRDEDISTYIDEEYSDQDSIFGTSHIEYISNLVTSTLNKARHEAFTTTLEEDVTDDDGRAYNLVQQLDLEIPPSGHIKLNRVYKIPPPALA